MLRTKETIKEDLHVVCTITGNNPVCRHVANQIGLPEDFDGKDIRGKLEALDRIVSYIRYTLKPNKDDVVVLDGDFEKDIFPFLENRLKLFCRPGRSTKKGLKVKIELL